MNCSRTWSIPPASSSSSAWKSVDALLEHLGAAHTQKLLGTVGKIADGPNRLDFYLNSDDR